MGRLVDVGFNWTYLNKYQTIDEEVACIKAVSLQDVNNLIAEFKPGNFTELSMGPGSFLA